MAEHSASSNNKQSSYDSPGGVSHVFRVMNHSGSFVSVWLTAGRSPRTSAGTTEEGAVKWSTYFIASVLKE